MTRAELLSLGGGRGHAWVAASVVSREELAPKRAWLEDRRQTHAMVRARGAVLLSEKKRQVAAQAAAAKEAREWKDAERKKARNKVACQKQRDERKAENEKLAEAARARSKAQYQRRKAVKQGKAAQAIQAWWRGVLARMALLHQPLPALRPLPLHAELPRPHH